MKLDPKPARNLVSIRQAQEADAVAFRDLRLVALRDHPDAFASDFAVNEAYPLSYWEERLRDLGANAMIFFASVNEVLIGMCGISRGYSPKTNHSAVIWGVYVRPEWRSLHLAEDLISACVEWGRAREVKVLKLGVVTSNSAAIRCYARCGFTIYGIDPLAIFYDQIGYDEFLMSRMI